MQVLDSQVVWKNNVCVYYIEGPNTSSTQEDFQEFVWVQKETSPLKTD